MERDPGALALTGAASASLDTAFGFVRANFVAILFLEAVDVAAAAWALVEILLVGEVANVKNCSLAFSLESCTQCSSTWEASANFCCSRAAPTSLSKSRSWPAILGGATADQESRKLQTRLSSKLQTRLSSEARKARTIADTFLVGGWAQCSAGMPREEEQEEEDALNFETATDVDPQVDAALDAAENGDVHSLVQLFQSVDVNATGDEGDTPLHIAALYGHVETVQECLKRGANVNARDEDASTPLHDACAGGHVDIAWLLIQKRANVNAVDSDGDTPLINASRGNHANCVELLLLHGADIDPVNGDGSSALSQVGLLSESSETMGVLQRFLAIHEERKLGPGVAKSAEERFDSWKSHWVQEKGVLLPSIESSNLDF